MTKAQWIRERINREFIKTNRLLEEILRLENTNALVVRNIMLRYERFSRQFS